VLLPYHVSSLALTAAETVIDYQQEFAAGIEKIIRERNRLAETLAAKTGIRVFSSETNFLLIQTANASRLAAMLADSGIGVRDFSRTPGLEGCLRITVGAPAENNAVINVIDKYCVDLSGQE